MRICYIATNSEITGATLSLLGLIDEMINMGNELLIVAMNRGYLTEELEKRKIRYIVISTFPTYLRIGDKRTLKGILRIIRKKWFDFFSYKKFEKLIHLEKIDIVHYNASTIDAGYKAFKKNNIPIVWHIRELLEEDLGGEFFLKNQMKKKLSDANRVIAISKSVEEKYECLHNIQLIYNGIDVDPFRKLIKRHERKICIGIVGRITEKKGQLEVLKAFNLLVKREFSDISLKIIGEFETEEYKQEILNYINVESLGNIVELTGPLKKPDEIWDTIDIAVIASHFEAFGRVTIEAVLAGSLVIGADTGGTKELLDYLQTGMLYQQGNIKDLEKKLEAALTLVKEVKEKEKIQKSKEKAFIDFSAKENARKIEIVYQKILSNIYI